MDEKDIERAAAVAHDSEWVPPRTWPTQYEEAMRVVLEELLRARAKHGDNCIDGPNYTETQRLAVLVEEVGEVAHELTYDAAKRGIEGGDTDRLLAEVVQVAAMALGWVAALVPREAAPAPWAALEGWEGVQAPLAASGGAGAVEGSA